MGTTSGEEAMDGVKFEMCYPGSLNRNAQPFDMLHHMLGTLTQAHLNGNSRRIRHVLIIPPQKKFDVGGYVKLYLLIVGHSFDKVIQQRHSQSLSLEAVDFKFVDGVADVLQYGTCASVVRTPALDPLFSDTL